MLSDYSSKTATRMEFFKDAAMWIGKFAIVLAICIAVVALLSPSRFRLNEAVGSWVEGTTIYAAFMGIVFFLFLITRKRA